jgi:ATP-binding cassette subfamily C protein
LSNAQEAADPIRRTMNFDRRSASYARARTPSPFAKFRRFVRARQIESVKGFSTVRRFLILASAYLPDSTFVTRHLPYLAATGRRLLDLRSTVDFLMPYVFRQKASPDNGYWEPKSEIGAFLRSCRWIFWALAIFSGLSNILMLTGSFFLLEVYDRVLPSHSMATLGALMILAIVLYLAYGAIDVIRGRISLRMGRHLDESLSDRVFESLVQIPLKTRGDGDGLQPIRDLDQVRTFLSGSGPTALFDLPWMPLYLGISFLFHVWIGTTALIGVIILVSLTILTETRTKAPSKASSGFAVSRSALALEARRNAEVLHAMGMRGHATLRWSQANRKYLAAHEAGNDIAIGLGGLSKTLRMVLQSVILAVGACLVLYHEATGGIIIASSILTARALAPVEIAIANWKGFVGARHAAKRLDQLLQLFPAETTQLELPPPTHSFNVEQLYVSPPGGDKPIVGDISFSLTAGQGLGIIGPSGSGKSSLARALVGVWPRAHGKVCLDHAPLEQWGPDAMGSHIGYLPQDVELFEGSVAANIARFNPKARANAVLEAAAEAGVHKLILSLPDGYSTKLGEGGMTLSAGQRQRIGLARALYGNPFLVVLDEPSSNLDSEGEEALTRAVLGVRRRGGIAIVVAHRPKSIEGVDLLLAVAQGKPLCFGNRNEVLDQVLAKPPAPKVASR